MGLREKGESNDGGEEEQDHGGAGLGVAEAGDKNGGEAEGDGEEEGDGSALPEEVDEHPAEAFHRGGRKKRAEIHEASPLDCSMSFLIWASSSELMRLAEAARRTRRIAEPPKPR